MSPRDQGNDSNYISGRKPGGVSEAFPVTLQSCLTKTCFLKHNNWSEKTQLSGTFSINASLAFLIWIGENFSGIFGKSCGTFAFIFIRFLNL